MAVKAEEAYCTCIEDDDGHTVEMCDPCNESIMNEDNPDRIKDR